MSAAARSETTTQARWIVKYYDRQRGGVWKCTFFDLAKAETFAAGKVLYGKPARAVPLTPAAKTLSTRAPAFPTRYPALEADEQAAADEARRAADLAGRPKSPALPPVRPRRISAHDVERLQARSHETNRTIEELLAEEERDGAR